MCSENTSLPPSFKRSRTISLWGKTLEIKNYICSEDGIHYREKPGSRLQLTIMPTSYCPAACPFCLAGDTSRKQFLDPEKLRAALLVLREQDLVRGVSISGGEPFTDISLLDEVISLVFELFGYDIAISMTTNGSGLHHIHRLRELPHLDALRISRHHYDEAINRSFFGIEVPSNARLKEIISTVSYRDLFFLNCLMLRDYIGTPEQAHRFLDFAIEMGVGRVAFLPCSPVNDFCREQAVDFSRLLRSDDPDLLFTRGYRDFDLCACQDGVYVSPSGQLMEFYGRRTAAVDCGYCRGLTFGADNHLRAGYTGPILL